MKQIFIFILLFLLVIALAILMDVLQGLDVYEALSAFLKIEQKRTAPEYVTILIFFLPLIISKSYHYIKNNKDN
ncbi:hypothetical protein AA0X95_19540 [Bacillus sp. 1P10SD]|uniref:hypothetical protein n=1 Tax=Bacillus sp. 1P10SD TaxID=3132265 RepID=UPI0039A4AD0D